MLQTHSRCCYHCFLPVGLTALKTCPLDGDKLDKPGCIMARCINVVPDFILQPVCQRLVYCTSRSLEHKQVSVPPTKGPNLVPRRCTPAARCSSEEVWLIARNKFHCTLCRCDSKESSVPKVKSSPTIVFFFLQSDNILEKITCWCWFTHVSLHYIFPKLFSTSAYLCYDNNV